MAILFRDDNDKDADFMKVYAEAAILNKGKILFSYASIGTEGSVHEAIAGEMIVTHD